MAITRTRLPAIGNTSSGPASDERNVWKASRSRSYSPSTSPSRKRLPLNEPSSLVPTWWRTVLWLPSVPATYDDVQVSSCPSECRSVERTSSSFCSSATSSAPRSTVTPSSASRSVSTRSVSVCAVDTENGKGLFQRHSPEHAAVRVELGSGGRHPTGDQRVDRPDALHHLQTASVYQDRA